MVRSIIGLAHNPSCRVVAEGVENQDQVDFLIGYGCGLFQGYFYHKPMPPEELADLWRSESSRPAPEGI